MLSIVETLKEFRNVLLGYEIEVFTDCANLTFETTKSSSQRLQHWRCLVQDFDVQLKYGKVQENVVADAISRLPKEAHAIGPFHSTRTQLARFLALTTCLSLMQATPFPLLTKKLSFR
jgi:hypothetical protein